MKLYALICAVTALSVAPAIASAPAAAIYQTGDQDNTFFAPATSQTTEVYTGAITAPPNFSFDVATQPDGTQQVAIVAPPEIAFTENRVCPADGRTEVILALIVNSVPAPNDVGKASINGAIGNFSDDTGYTIGGTTVKDSGGGVSYGAGAITG